MHEIEQIDKLGELWRDALDAAERSLEHASPLFHGRGGVAQRAALLRTERSAAALELERFAHAHRIEAWYSDLRVPGWRVRGLLSVGPHTSTCVFDLDALVETDQLHIAAWRDVLDELLFARSDRTGKPLDPFDPATDYDAYLAGRPRLDGIRSFLGSRGISLPEGGSFDPPSSPTVYGVSHGKERSLVRHLDGDRLSPAPGARRYLELARDARLTVVVVSPSAHAAGFLARAGLISLVDACVAGPGSAVAPAGWEMAARVAACEVAGTSPQAATAYETTSAGTDAARAAGFDAVVAVSGEVSLRTLLERRLAAIRG